LWPRTRVTRITLVVYVLTALLAVAFHSQIQWSWYAFGEFVQGKITSDDTEYRLRAEAMRALDAGEFEAALNDARQADRIDPDNSMTLYILAEASRRLQDTPAAVQYYERLNRHDPTMIQPYLRLAELYQAGNEPRRSEEILQAGADYFTAAVRNMQPQPDSSVPKRYSKKSVVVYQRMRKSLYGINKQLQEREGRQ
jgi:tetratricopeptide (TPR) repeat protein